MRTICVRSLTCSWHVDRTADQPSAISSLCAYAGKLRLVGLLWLGRPIGAAKWCAGVAAMHWQIATVYNNKYPNIHTDIHTYVCAVTYIAFSTWYLFAVNLLFIVSFRFTFAICAHKTLRLLCCCRCCCLPRFLLSQQIR